MLKSADLRGFLRKNNFFSLFYLHFSIFVVI